MGPAVAANLHGLVAEPGPRELHLRDVRDAGLSPLRGDDGVDLYVGGLVGSLGQAKQHEPAPVVNVEVLARQVHQVRVALRPDGRRRRRVLRVALELPAGAARQERVGQVALRRVRARDGATPALLDLPAALRAAVLEAQVAPIRDGALNVDIAVLRKRIPEPTAEGNLVARDRSDEDALPLRGPVDVPADDEAVVDVEAVSRADVQRRVPTEVVLGGEEATQAVVGVPGVKRPGGARRALEGAPPARGAVGALLALRAAREVVALGALHGLVGRGLDGAHLPVVRVEDVRPLRGRVDAAVAVLVPGQAGAVRHAQCGLERALLRGEAPVAVAVVGVEAGASQAVARHPCRNCPLQRLLPLLHGRLRRVVRGVGSRLGELQRDAPRRNARGVVRSQLHAASEQRQCEETAAHNHCPRWQIWNACPEEAS
mmetsp:Transcript_87495/g.231524  ORF Transcript_87495/g.231524 Transcript_87495/m.231524 type:complete len:429 (+) Transcript_87495:1176-2462(+)